VTANDRRLAIMEYLCERRHATRRELQEHFHVSHGTIEHDLVVLSCSYPIFICAGNHGGIYLEEGYYLDKRFLSAEQEQVVRTLIASSVLDENQRAAMQSILDKFAHKGVKK